MDLVEIDVVELQPLQALVDRMQDVGTRQPDLVGPGAHLAAHLGRNHDGIARHSQCLQRLAGQALGASGVIDVRGIQKIHAAVDGRAHDAIDRFLAEAADGCPHALGIAEGHGAKTDLRNDEAGIAELLHAHVQVS